MAARNGLPRVAHVLIAPTINNPVTEPIPAANKPGPGVVTMANGMTEGAAPSRNSPPDMPAAAYADRRSSSMTPNSRAVITLRIDSSSWLKC